MASPFRDSPVPALRRMAASDADEAFRQGFLHFDGESGDEETSPLKGFGGRRQADQGSDEGDDEGSDDDGDEPPSKRQRPQQDRLTPWVLMRLYDDDSYCEEELEAPTESASPPTCS